MRTTRWMRTCLAFVFSLLFALSMQASLAADPLKITVYGGSGRIGQRIVNEALNRGHTVTVVVRDPSSVKEKRERLSVAKGDISDSAGIEQQIAGQDVVISTVNSREAEFFPNAAKSLVAAVRKVNKPPRILWVGGAGSLEIEPGKTLADTMPSRGGAVLGHKQALDYFRSVNDVSWTFISPSMQIEPGARTGKFRLGKDQLLKDDKGNSRISMEDFAVAMIDEAEKPQHIRSRFTVGY